MCRVTGEYCTWALEYSRQQEVWIRHAYRGFEENIAFCCQPLSSSRSISETDQCFRGLVYLICIQYSYWWEAVSYTPPLSPYPYPPRMKKWPVWAFARFRPWLILIWDGGLPFHSILSKIVVEITLRCTGCEEKKFVSVNDLCALAQSKNRMIIDFRVYWRDVWSQTLNALITMTFA